MFSIDIDKGPTTYIGLAGTSEHIFYGIDSLHSDRGVTLNESLVAASIDITTDDDGLGRCLRLRLQAHKANKANEPYKSYKSYGPHKSHESHEPSP